MSAWRGVRSEKRSTKRGGARAGGRCPATCLRRGRMKSLGHLVVAGVLLLALGCGDDDGGAQDAALDAATPPSDAAPSDAAVGDARSIEEACAECSDTQTCVVAC